MTLFTVVALASGAALDGAMSATATSRNRNVAASLVSQTLDQVESTPFQDVTNLAGTTTEAVNGVTYTITQTVLPATAPPTSGTPTTCNFTAAGTDGEFLVVNVKVSWAGPAVSPATGQVEVSPPADVISEQYANLTLQVVGATGNDVSGTSVSINTTPTQQATTNSSGCVSFTDLLPGSTYTVTSSSFLIDQTQADQASPPVATWTSPVLVADTATSQVLTWDTPTQITIGALTIPTGYTAPTGCSSSCVALPANLEASVANGGGGNDTLNNLAYGTATDVYPYSGGWTTWAGECSGAATSGATAVNTPDNGLAVTANAALFPVTLTPGKSLSANGTITATCSGGAALSWSFPSGGAGPFKIAVPAGTWTFKTTSTNPNESVVETVTSSGGAWPL